jgi:heme/copper-type cytochrome/quinol oxidase subunit 3
VSDYVAGGVPERLVPRTTDARNAREAAALARRRGGPTVSIWGMAMLVASEATLFGTFIGSYYYLRFTTPIWPPRGMPEPAVVVPLVLAGVLATTSLPMQLAVVAARAGRLAPVRAFVSLALVVQAGYFAFEIHDYLAQLHTMTPQDDAYGSIFFTLLGADHAHVFFGLVFDVWLLWKLRKGLTMYRLNAVQVIAFYWHFVNLMTLVVIGVLLSATF